jgi:tetratricopeptide (TPR) repeat protein
VESAAWQKQRRLPEALSAARRADGLVRAGTAEEALRRRVQARLADLELLERLENASLEGAALKDGHLDNYRTVALYRDVFRAAGLDVEGLPPQEAAEQLRRTTVAAELAAFLDDWAPFSASPRREHLLAVARAVEPEGTPAHVRDALRDMQREALVKLAASEEARDLLPATVRALATGLMKVDAPESAKALLREARRRHPDDFWLNEDLGRLLLESQPPLPQEASRYFTAAVSLRPNSEAAHLCLGLSLYHTGQLDGACAEYREALRLKKDYASAHTNLGLVLAMKGEADGALREWRAAIQCNPKDSNAYRNLGIALADKGDVAGAIAFHKQAIALEPKDPEHHHSLGITLCDKKHDYSGAIACFRAAIALDPKISGVHSDLGVALHNKGRLDEAIAEYREAIRLKKDHIQAHCYLGIALKSKGDVEGAIREYRAAIRINPKDAVTHYSLGNVLSNKGDLEGAIREYQAAIQTNPQYAEAHCNLGDVLSRQGRFADALAAFKRGHALGLKDPHWSYPSAQWVRQAEQIVGLEGKLPKFLKGEAQPSDNAERLALAKCATSKKRYAGATHFYAQALAAQPELADDLETGHRYDAACAAALAGCGRGEDVARLDDRQRARLRRQALDWLRADLDLRAKQVAGNRPKDRAAARMALACWLGNADFAGVRGDAVAKLPESERQGWRTLWADVAKTLARARGRAAAEKKSDSK